MTCCCASSDCTGTLLAYLHVSGMRQTTQNLLVLNRSWGLNEVIVASSLEEEEGIVRDVRVGVDEVLFQAQYSA